MPSCVWPFDLAVLVRNILPLRVAVRTMDTLGSLPSIEIERAAGRFQPLISAVMLRDWSHATILCTRPAFGAVARPRERALQQRRIWTTDHGADQRANGSKRWRAGVLSGKLAAASRRRRTGHVLTRLVRATSRALTIAASWLHIVLRRLRAFAPSDSYQIVAAHFDQCSCVASGAARFSRPVPSSDESSSIALSNIDALS